MATINTAQNDNSTGSACDTLASVIASARRAADDAHVNAQHDTASEAEDHVRHAILNESLSIQPFALSEDLEAVAHRVVDHVERVLRRMGTGPACVELKRTSYMLFHEIDELGALHHTQCFHPRWSDKRYGRGCDPLPVATHRAPYVIAAKQVITAGIARVRRQLEGDVLQ